jgi:hypothetical protein
VSLVEGMAQQERNLRREIMEVRPLLSLFFRPHALEGLRYV